MNGRIDVIEVLRLANPVPPESINERQRLSAERRASLRVVPTDVLITSFGEEAAQPQRRWPKYAAAITAVAAGLAALVVVPRWADRNAHLTTTADTTATVASGYVGVWLSVDPDGSSQTMEIVGSVSDELQVVLFVAAAEVCAGAPATITGSGRLDTDGSFVVTESELTCDDGTAPPQVERANLAFAHDPATDDLVDESGVVWRRQGVTTAETPTSTVPVAPLWVAVDPGATAPLPAAPIPSLSGSSLVWTGTEVIVWGGRVDDGSCCSWSQAGAAFDPAAGAWRQIASPPAGVTTGTVVWTGAEMIVLSNGNPATVSAAYDPATNAWRVIADPPVPGSVAFWIGDAVILLGDVEVPGGTVPGSGFAYVPNTDEWRRLADGAWDVPAIWTGTTIIVVADTDSITGNSLAGYDPATDTWRVLEGVDAGDVPVLLPGRDGAPATLALLSGDAGTPVELLDDRGNAIGELTGRPEELPSSACAEPPGNTGCLIVRSARAVSVGGELLFWHGEDGWAFNPEAQTWRALPLDGRQPTWDGTEVVAAGDLLFAWGAGRDGLVYRAAASEGQ